MDGRIGQRIQQVSKDVLQVQQGWVRAEWRDSENNRRAKFYSRTLSGRSGSAKSCISGRRPYLGAINLSGCKTRFSMKNSIMCWLFTPL
jgi:hypothetical protein